MWGLDEGVEGDVRAGHGPGPRRAGEGVSCQSSQGPAGTSVGVDGVEEPPADLGPGGPAHRPAEDLGEELAAEADPEHGDAVARRRPRPGDARGRSRGRRRRSRTRSSPSPRGRRRSRAAAATAGRGRRGAWTRRTRARPRSRRARPGRRSRCAGGRRCGRPRSSILPGRGRTGPDAGRVRARSSRPGAGTAVSASGPAG